MSNLKELIDWYALWKDEPPDLKPVAPQVRPNPKSPLQIEEWIAKNTPPIQSYYSVVDRTYRVQDTRGYEHMFAQEYVEDYLDEFLEFVELLQ